MNDEILAAIAQQREKVRETLRKLDAHRDKLLAGYIWNYVQEELSRGHSIERSTIENAIDAFNGGAR